MSPKVDFDSNMMNILAVQNLEADEKTSPHHGKGVVSLVQVLEEIREELTEEKSGSTSQNVTLAPSSTQGNSNGGSAYENAMAQLTLAMQMLQVLMAKAGQSKLNSDQEISNHEIALSQQNLQDVQAKLAKMQEEKESQEKTQSWLKWVELAVTIVVAVAACIAGQPELAILAVAMYAASQAGAFKWMADGIASGLKEIPFFKNNPEIADIVATVVVLVIVIALTLALCPSAAGTAVGEATEVGEETAENSVEMVDMGEQATEETASTSSEQSENATQSLKSKIGDFLSKANPFNKSMAANMTVMNSLTALSQMNLNEIVEDWPGLSAEKKKEVEMIMGIVIAVLSLIAALGTAFGGASSLENLGNGTAKSMFEGTAMLKVLQQANSAELMDGLETTRKILTVFASLLQVGEGSLQIEQGITAKDLANDTAAMTRINAATEMMNVNAASTQKQTADMMKQSATGTQNFLESFNKGNEEFSRILTTQSPV